MTRLTSMRRSMRTTSKGDDAKGGDVQEEAALLGGMT